MINKNQIIGMIPPIVTPFDEKGNIDFEAIRKEIRYLLSTGIDGISSGGSTGEGVILTDEDNKEILKIIKEENINNIPVVAGIIKNSTENAIRSALVAKEAGADALLVTPVFYFGATLEGNYEYYNSIAEATKLPIIIYNVIPTNQITPQAMLKLSEIEQVIGIKQVDITNFAEMVSLCGDKINVYCARDDLLYSTYVLGAVGAISAMITVAPEQCVKQWEAFQNGDQATAMEIQSKLFHVYKAYEGRPFPGKVKEILKQLGRQVGICKSPILEPDKEEKDYIGKGLKKAGLLK